MSFSGFPAVIGGWQIRGSLDTDVFLDIVRDTMPSGVIDTGPVAELPSSLALVELCVLDLVPF